MPIFQPIQDVVKDLCLREGDLQQLNKMLYLNCAKDVWMDLNLSVVKVPVRERFQINKKTNTVNLPKSSIRLSGVDVEGADGVLYPVFRNDKLHDDIVDVTASKDCACEYKCGNTLCNTIKGYQAVVSVKSDSLPNGTPISFTCVDRKAILGNFFYSETQYPLRIYLSGVWTDTILYTEQKQLCPVEVDNNGCVIDSESNITALCDACGFSKIFGTPANPNPIPIGGDANSFYCDPKVNEWIYHPSNKLDWFSVQCGFGHGKGSFNNIYNISEDGDRLIFPRNFGYGSVVVRYYSNVELKNLQIPLETKITFMAGLKYFSTMFNDKRKKYSEVYQTDYRNLKWGLESELNKYRLDELRMILTPPVRVPSYISYYR